MKELDYNKLPIGVTILRSDKIVYKRLMGAIVQLLLPKGTRVMKSINGIKKLRTDKAIVLMIVDFEEEYIYSKETSYPISRKRKYQYLTDKIRVNLCSGRAKRLYYKMGNLIEVSKLDTNKYEHCGRGIHFFTKLKQAERY